jgi:hypothetical protein
MDALAHRLGVGEGAEIARALVEAAAVEGDARTGVGRQLDVGIGLVVAEEDVVLRRQALDEVVLEDQRLGLGARGGHLDAGHLPHHEPDARAQVGFLEIGGDALLQVLGLADVEHLAVGVEHAVDPGFLGQGTDQGLAVEHVSLQVGADGVEDGVEGRLGQPPGLRVVAAAVIAVVEDAPVRQHMAGAMGELAGAALQSQCLQHGVVRHQAEREDDARLGRRRQLVRQETVAGLDFTRFRLVLRRHALHGVGDAAVDQLQAVIRRHGLRPAGEAEAMQGGIQQDAGVVAGERPSAAVGAVIAGREADDEQRRLGIAEGLHRPRVIARPLSRRQSSRKSARRGQARHSSNEVCGAGMLTPPPLRAP